MYYYYKRIKAEKSCEWSSANRCEDSLKKTSCWATSKKHTKPNQTNTQKERSKVCILSCWASKHPHNHHIPQQLCHCNLELLDPELFKEHSYSLQHQQNSKRKKILLAEGRFSSPR